MPLLETESAMSWYLPWGSYTSMWPVTTTWSPSSTSTRSRSARANITQGIWASSSLRVK